MSNRFSQSFQVIDGQFAVIPVPAGVKAVSVYVSDQAAASVYATNGDPFLAPIWSKVTLTNGAVCIDSPLTAVKIDAAGNGVNGNILGDAQ